MPDCQQDHTKQVVSFIAISTNILNRFYVFQGQSKGGILAKATEYIQELCAENARMNEVLKENELLRYETIYTLF